MVARSFRFARLKRCTVHAAALAWMLFGSTAWAAAPPARGCGLPALHPGVKSHASDTLRARSGLPPLPGPIASFASGGSTACPDRPVLASAQTIDGGTFVIHYRPEDAALAADVRDWMDDSWAKITGAAPANLGFPAPISDGDGKIDVYLEPGTNVGGYYCPEQYQFGQDFVGTSGFISINPDITDVGFLQAAVAHELHHASQFAIDALEDASFMEMSSAYAMEKVFDSADEAAGFIYEFQRYPGWSFDFFDDGGIYHYGASLFLFWLLDEQYGSSQSYEVFQYLWYASAQPYGDGTNEPDFLDAMQEVAEVNDVDFADFYAEFSADRWYTGRFDDGTFTEGGTYEEPNDAETVPSRDLLDGETIDAGSISELGVGYVRVTLDDPSDEATLAVDWDNDTGTSWVVVVMKQSGERAVLGEGDSGSEVVDDLEGEEWVAFGFVNTGDGSHDADADDFATSDAGVTLTFDDPNAGSGGGGGGEKGPLGCSVAPIAGGSRARPGMLALIALALGLATARRPRD